MQDLSIEEKRISNEYSAKLGQRVILYKDGWWVADYRGDESMPYNIGLGRTPEEAYQDMLNPPEDGD